MIQDVSNQVVMEGALEESRERFQNFAEVSADWFWEIDADLRISFVSESVERIMGIPSAWIIGKLRPDLADTAADREQWAQHVADLEARRPFRDFECLRRVDGEVRTCWIRSSGMPVFGEDG
jgi:PAS domain S-box-containing protein